MELLTRGKVKDVYSIDDDFLLFRFSDRISVFDKIIPSEIPGKGETLCGESAFWFGKVGRMGIKTDFVEVVAPEKMKVKRVSVIHDVRKLNKNTRNYQIPLECILRWYCAGSLHKSLKEGKVKPREVGLSRVPEYGEALPEPIFEVTTKFEKFDRKLAFDEALKISGLDKRELLELKECCIRIDEMMQREVKKRGLIHVDGKKEFALDGARELMVIDTFGTADEDRWWDRKAYESGNIIEFSKEFVRKYYETEVMVTDKKSGETLSYKDLLYRCRDRGDSEPDIPALPKGMVDKTSSLYLDLYGRITGAKP